jgi:hypothetical protein
VACPAIVAPLVPTLRLRRGLAYWEQLRGNRPMPARADIGPADLPRPLTSVMLVDVLQDPLDFRFRLVGSDIEAISFRNYRGVRFSEIFHMGPKSRLFGEYRHVVQTRRPHWSEVDYVGFDPGISRIRHILLPLSDDGDKVDTVLVFVEIERARLRPVE